MALRTVTSDGRQNCPPVALNLLARTPSPLSKEYEILSKLTEVLELNSAHASE